MEPATSLKTKHLPSLDGLRAVSIIFVMGFHGLGPITGLFAVSGGWIGVEAFFVISGFLITTLLLEERARTGGIDLAAFYYRRFLRLAPAFLVFLVVAAVINVRQCNHMLAGFCVAALSLADYDLALGWGNIWGTGYEIIWSLSVEEKFYLLWPSALLLFRRSSLLFAVAILCGCIAWKGVLVSQNAGWLRLSSAFDSHLDSLACGIIAALVLQRRASYEWVKNEAKDWWGIFLAIAALFLALTIGHPSDLQEQSSRYLFWMVRLPVFSMCIAALIVCLVERPRSFISKILSAPLMTWTGRLSYSLYLWHGMFVYPIDCFVKEHALGAYAGEFMKLAVAFALASGSYYLIEKPFLRLNEKTECVEKKPSGIVPAAEDLSESIVQTALSLQNSQR